MDVRENVVWHDGSPLTPEDIIWSIQRNAKPDGGNPVSFIWAGIDNFKVDGKRITADVKQYDPVIFKWMAFLTGYVLPKAYYEKVGAEGFEKKPIGTGPYMVDAYEGNAYLRLKANPKYWGGKPPFETVVFKFVPDATSRVAEIESGSSDVTSRSAVRGIRPPQRQSRTKRSLQTGLRSRHALHHQWRGDG